MAGLTRNTPLRSKQTPEEIRAKREEAAQRWHDRRQDETRRRIAAGERVGLAPVSERKRERDEAEGRAPRCEPLRRGDGFATSTAQRRKVREEGGCRILAFHEHDAEDGRLPDDVARALGTWAPSAIDPMHVIDRALGGCDDPDCIIPGDRRLHGPYDRGDLDILRYLKRKEVVHAVRKVGILSALKRITGKDYEPDGRSPEGRDRLPEMSKDEQADLVDRFARDREAADEPAGYALFEALEEATGVSSWSAPREATTGVTW